MLCGGGGGLALDFQSDVLVTPPCRMPLKGSGVSEEMKGGLCVRNGPGVQEWTDGSRYEGEFLNGLKHGNGIFTWPNGEVTVTI